MRFQTHPLGIGFARDGGMAALIDSHTRAARLARTIASDITAYMQVNEVQNPDAKRAEMDRQIEQGRVYFRSRVISELGEQGIYEEVVESLSL